MRTKLAPLWIAWLALIAAPALAVDGVREINHTCATTTGCFTGDTMGYPVTITLTGSYRLTSNLTLANANTDGISVATADVSIDLNGFAITGITNCTGGPTVCTDPGTGRGIASGGEFVRNLSVRNGTVAKMGAIGIYVGQHSQVQDVRVISNGSTGIVGASGIHVLRCTVARNGNGGIDVGDGVVADNVVQFAGGTLPGIYASGGVVRGNNVIYGAADGIYGTNGTVIIDNRSIGNGGNGISVLGASTISRNTVQLLSGVNGILVSGGTRITENTISMGSNTGFAIGGGLEDGYADNLITHADPAPWVGVLVEDLGGNLCNGGAC